MSDPTSPESSEESVRRLLAEARHTEPLPPEFAARLDDLLGELVAARAAGAGVPSLAARRHLRHRRRGLLLVAAAAAVVAVAVPTIRGVDRGGDDTTASDSSASESSAGSADSSTQSRSGLAQAPAPSADLGAASALPSLVLTSGGFDAEVRRALLALPGGGSAYHSTLTLLPAGCDPPADAAYAVLLYATYDGDPALLRAGLPSAGRQEAVLYRCGEPDPVRRTTVDLSR